MAVTEPEAVAGKRRVSTWALVTLAIVAVIVYAFDQVAKYFVVKNLPLGETVPFIGQILQFHFVKNAGAAFSFGSGSTWVFALIACAVAVFLVVFARRIHSAGWAVLFGLLLGGTLGNLTDRLFREPSFGQGHVIDFLQLIYFPAIFNIADTAIVSSMALFIILTIRGIGLDGKIREDKKDADEKDEPALADESIEPAGSDPA